MPVTVRAIDPSAAMLRKGRYGRAYRKEPHMSQTATPPDGATLLKFPSKPLRGILDHALDAQTENDRQEYALANGCPRACDSIDEHLDAIEAELSRPRPDPAVVHAHARAIRGLVVYVYMSNRDERRIEQAIASTADEMARVARAVETGHAPGLRPRRQLAAAIRDALDPIAAVTRGELVSADRLMRANVQLREIVRSCPAQRLLSDGMANELGVEKARLLARAVADLS